MPSFAPVVKQSAPAIVNIRVIRESLVVHPFMNDPAFSFFFGENGNIPQKLRQEGAGSGNIVRKDGLVLTCAHVIQGGQKIIIKLPDGRTFEGKVIYVDEQNDIALVKMLDLKPGEEIPVVALGDSDALEVGDFIIAVGYPFGIQQTVTSGIISSKRQEFKNGVVLQTDAPVNPGNSGGAVINMRGELVGIPNAILSKTGASHGIGFAIPSNTFRTLVNNVDDTGNIKLTWHGFRAQRILGNLNNPNKIKGVIVSSIIPNSPAAEGGLKRDDVITHINGRDINSPADLHEQIAKINIGEKVSLTLLRHSVKQEISYTVSSMSSSVDKPIVVLNGPLSGSKLAPLTPYLRRSFNIEDEIEGLVVMELAPTGAAQKMNLQKGDVIVSVNNTKLRTLNDLKKISPSPQGISLQVHRGAGTTSQIY